DVTGDLPEDLNWAALADPGCTTVLFMGKRTFPAMASALIAQGLSPETPALLAEAVGHPTQALHRMTIAALADHLTQNRSDQPALILYGPLAAP
ncbi:MAG: uroporphyrinogen-III C-methyltransferase, partial [Paracoccaceae bacterium]